MSNSLWSHESQHARPPCPSPSPGVHSDSRPSSLWCHPAISSSVIPFSSCLQSLPTSESFPVSQVFAWGGQSTGASALASFLPRNPRVDLLQNGLVGSPCSARDSQESSPTPQFKSIKKESGGLNDGFGVLYQINRNHATSLHLLNWEGSDPGSSERECVGPIALSTISFVKILLAESIFSSLHTLPGDRSLYQRVDQ